MEIYMRCSFSYLFIWATLALTLPAGVMAADQVSCRMEGDKQIITTQAQGATYAVNGTVRSMAKSQGWRDGSERYEPTEMLSLLQEGIAICDPSKAVKASPVSAQAPAPQANPSGRVTVDHFTKAADQGDLDTLKLYLSQGGDVNAKDKGVPGLFEGSSAIYAAAASGKCEALDFLLKSGANPDPKGVKFGYTPLSHAAQAGANACVKSLLAKKVRVDVRTEAGGDTALIMAAYYGHMEIVQLLIDHGASLKLQNKDGDTPYRAAMVMGNRRVAQYLQSKGGS